MALILDHDDIIQLIGFHVGSRLFGANIVNVKEIIRDPIVDATDVAPEFIEYIVKVRGECLPVVDLHRILNVPSTAQGQAKKWILVARAGKRNVGYMVDEVTPIIRIKTNAVLPTPDIILSGLRSKYIQGVCETEKGLLVMVDLERMLVEDEIKTIDQIAIG